MKNSICLMAFLAVCSYATAQTQITTEVGKSIDATTATLTPIKMDSNARVIQKVAKEDVKMTSKSLTNGVNGPLKVEPLSADKSTPTTDKSTPTTVSKPQNTVTKTVPKAKPAITTPTTTVERQKAVCPATTGCAKAAGKDCCHKAH